MNRFNVRQVAVLGAGVMGAQIAAHLVNVKVPVVLFDLPAKEGPKSGIALKAIDNLKKLKPAPLGVADDAVRIRAANYEDDLALLGQCDLVIEAIAERMDWKLDLYGKIAPHVAAHAIVASNTSGLSITQLAEALPASIQPRFCGIHFFNPPRYMQLVELIPTPTTEAGCLDQLETFVTTTLGKGVVRAKDTPNFIANRVGIAGMLATIHEAQKFGLSYDVVDDLTGKKMGRASSGTFRTADVVGLDTMAHVIRTLQDNLGPDKANDPFFPSYATPAALTQLIAAGALGQKAKAGFYKKVGKDILRFDAASGDYVPGGKKADPIVDRILKKPAAERLKLLRESTHPQAQFLWAILRDGFHYVAVHLADIADSAREVDFAMRWGFGMKQGPFELWQEAGWQQVAGWVKEDIEAGKALCSRPAAGLGVRRTHGGAHAGGLLVAGTGQLPAALGAAGLRAPVLPGNGGRRRRRGRAEIRHRAVQERRDPPLDPRWQVLIASITSKMHLIGTGVIEGLAKAVELAEAGYQGVVIWSPDDVFSAGANLESLLPVFMKSGAKGIAPIVKELQDTMLRLRYANVPVVAAVRGLALGGGCEIALACDRRVAHMESYVGLVEVGVGLLPAGGGLTTIARRAAERAPAGADLLPFLKDSFQAAAMATVGTSALESRKLGYLQDGDIVVAHRDELLHVAIGQVKAMVDAGYRPPPKSQIPGGRPQRDRHHQGLAGGHARRRLHHQARLPHRQPDRRRGLRRRAGCRHRGDRGVPDGPGAQALLRAAGAPEEPGAGHGPAAIRQACAQLNGATRP
jgi:3-hydroxyacyl-CoA dehydrogenase